MECWTLDVEDPARGRKYKRTVVDEAAMVRDLLHRWDAAVRPTLADLIGDAWFLSTPKGLNGFHALYQRGQEAGEWKSWRSPTTDNPYISASEIEAARLDTPEREFAQEYLAEFLNDGGGVFRKVLDAATAKPLERGEKNKKYVYGCDWGRHHDFTVVSVLDPQTKTQVALERFNRIEFAFQVGRIKAMAERFPPLVIVAEKNSFGEPVIEAMRREHLPVFAWNSSNATKAAAIEALALAFERGALRILEDKTQLGELLAYDAERLPSGMLRYSAPDGMHDDTVVALMLANLAVQNPPREGRLIDFEMVA